MKFHNIRIFGKRTLSVDAFQGSMRVADRATESYDLVGKSAMICFARSNHSSAGFKEEIDMRICR